MFIIIQVKARDFASLSMHVSYNETEAKQPEQQNHINKIEKSACSFKGELD